jgi:hypothetical protein
MVLLKMFSDVVFLHSGLSVVWFRVRWEAESKAEEGLIESRGWASWREKNLFRVEMLCEVRGLRPSLGMALLSTDVPDGGQRLTQGARLA